MPGAVAGAGVVIVVVAAGLDVVLDVVSEVVVSSPPSSPPPQAVSVKASAAAAMPVVTEKRRKIKRSVMGPISISVSGTTWQSCKYPRELKINRLRQLRGLLFAHRRTRESIPSGAAAFMIFRLYIA